MSEAHRLHVANAADKKFDGDCVSFNVCMVQESLDEVKTLMGKASTYLNSGGGFKTSAGIDTVNLALYNMTSR